jgi:hypothetical protein
VEVYKFCERMCGGEAEDRKEGGVGAGFVL